MIFAMRNHYAVRSRAKMNTETAVKRGASLMLDRSATGDPDGIGQPDHGISKTLWCAYNIDNSQRRVDALYRPPIIRECIKERLGVAMNSRLSSAS